MQAWNVPSGMKFPAQSSPRVKTSRHVLPVELFQKQEEKPQSRPASCQMLSLHTVSGTSPSVEAANETTAVVMPRKTEGAREGWLEVPLAALLGRILRWHKSAFPH